MTQPAESRLKLSRGARRLLRRIEDLTRKNDEAYAHQGTLAEWLDVSARTVKRYFAELTSAGLIVVRRTRRGNRYRIAAGDKMSPGEGTKCPLARGQNVPCYLDDKELTKDSSSAAAAERAPSEPQAEASGTVEAMRDLGLPFAGEPAAIADPKLADAVLAHVTWRFRSGRPVRSQPGYMLDCLRDPMKFGFNRDASGTWHPPPGEFVPTQPAQIAGRAMTAEEVQLKAATQKLKTLSPEDLQKIELLRAEGSPEWITYPPTIATLSAACSPACCATMRSSPTSFRW